MANKGVNGLVAIERVFVGQISDAESDGGDQFGLKFKTLHQAMMINGPDFLWPDIKDVPAFILPGQSPGA